MRVLASAWHSDMKMVTKMKPVATGLSVIALLTSAACSSEPDDDVAVAQEGTGDPGVDNGPPPPPEGPSEATVVDAASTGSGAPAAEIEGITNQRLTFAPGTSSTRIEGEITGDETIDYLLDVRAGQSLNISMASPNSAAYFNVLEPGETEVAVFNGSMGENMFEGVAAQSGTYRIRVYLYRSAARRGETAAYTLEVAAD